MSCPTDKGALVAAPSRNALAEKLDGLRALARETGAANASLYVASRLLARLAPSVGFFRYLLVAQPVTATPLAAATRRSTIAVRQIAREDYRLGWFPRPQAVIDARFAQGATCFAAFRDAEPVGCLWLQPGPYLEDEVRCRFVPLPAGGAMWDFDVYVVPELRGGRVFAYLWSAASAWARARGIAWTMSRINAFNLESIRSHRRLGARVVGSATFVAAGRLQLVLARRPFRFSLSRVDVPSLDVRAPKDD